jgi:hypothetical protein
MKKTEDRKSARVPQSESLPFGTKQERTYTCIPTNMAAILRLAGVKTEDPSDGIRKDIDGEIVKEWYFKSTISFEALEKSELFATPTKPAKNPDFRGCTIHAEGGFSSFQQWWSAVYRHIDRGSYVLLSMTLSVVGPHVVTAYEINDRTVRVYNPDPSPDAQTTWTKQELADMWNPPDGQVPRLNHDILVVTLRSSSV